MAFEYPFTPEARAAQSMLGGQPQNVPSGISDQFTRVNKMFGSNDLDKVARKESIGAGIAPWPSAGKVKKGQPYDKGAVREALTQPRDLQKTDPRLLHATQPGITRGGVEYYMTDEYKRTGRTFADQGNPGNRNPVVYNKNDGKRLLLSGHHRATAALLRGEQFDAIHVYGE